MNDTLLAFQHLVLAIAIPSSTVASAIACAVPRWEESPMPTGLSRSSVPFPAGLTLWVQELVLRGAPRRGFNGSAGPWQPGTAPRTSSTHRANGMLRTGPLMTHRARFRMLRYQAARARQIWIAQQLHVKTGCTQLRGAA